MIHARVRVREILRVSLSLPFSEYIPRIDTMKYEINPSSLDFFFQEELLSRHFQQRQSDYMALLFTNDVKYILQNLYILW